MIPQNNQDFNFDSSNIDEQETLTNRSPNEYAPQSDLHYLSSSYDKYLDSYELNQDKRKWSPAARAAYTQAKRESALRPDDTKNLAVRPDRYDSGFGDVVVDSRFDWFGFTVLAKYMPAIEKYTKDNFGMVWHDRDKGTQFYNHSKEAVGLPGFVEYSLKSDLTGVANNKDRATYTFKGSFCKSISLIKFADFMVFIKDDCKAINITRQDSRISEKSRYFLPEQIGGHLEHTYQTTGKYPVSNIRVNLEKGLYPTLNGGAGRHTLTIGKEERLIIYCERVKHGEDSIAYEVRHKQEKATCTFNYIVNTYKCMRELASHRIIKELKEEYKEQRKQAHYDRYVKGDINALQVYANIMATVYNSRLEKYLSKLLHEIICQIVLSSHTILDINGEEHEEWAKFKSLVGVVESYRPFKPTPVRALAKSARFLKKNAANSYIAIAGHCAGFSSNDDIQRHIDKHGMAATILYLNINYAEFYNETLEEQLTNGKFKKSIHAKKLMAESLIAA